MGAGLEGLRIGATFLCLLEGRAICRMAMASWAQRETGVGWRGAYRLAAISDAVNRGEIHALWGDSQ
jgi:hypothetical protein